MFLWGVNQEGFENDMMGSRNKNLGFSQEHIESLKKRAGSGYIER